MKKINKYINFILFFNVILFFSCKEEIKKQKHKFIKKQRSGKNQVKTIKQKEPTTIRFLKYIIPDNINSDNPKLVTCNTHLSKLKKNIKEFKNMDKKDTIFTNSPNILHKVLYSHQTPLKSTEKVVEFGDVVQSNVNGSKNVKLIDNQKNTDEIYKSKIQTLLLGEKNYNDYLKTLIHGHKENEDLDLFWRFYIDDKLWWITTLICNKARTVTNDPNNLNELFQGNKEMQEKIKKIIDGQQEFLNSYFDLVKQEKTLTVDYLINKTGYIKNNNISEAEKNEIYFRALVSNCKRKVDYLLKRFVKNESSTVMNTRNEVFEITDELLKIDPKGQSIVEFTKICYNQRKILTGINKFFKSKSQSITTTKQKSAQEIANNMIVTMTKLKKILGSTMAREFVIFVRKKDHSKPNSTIKLENKRLRLLLKLMAVYLKFGIYCLEYLKTCKKEVIIERVSNEQ